MSTALAFIFILALICIFVLAVIAIFAPKPDKDTVNSVPEIVSNSSWDGSVSQVKDWLNKNTREPNSLEFIEWTKVQKTNEGFMVRCKYRAKNGFGGYNVENQIFILDPTGKVIDCIIL